MTNRIRFRIGLSLFVVLVVFFVFAGYIYKIQPDPESVTPESMPDTYTYYTYIPAARGNILDRNGNVLVTNRASYNLTIVNYTLFNSDDPNGSLLALIEKAESLGIDYADHLPVSLSRPYAYTTEDYSSVWAGYFKTYMREQSWDTDISAENLIRLMRKKYSIPDDWTDEQVRQVIGIRYELSLRYYTTLDIYTFAEDVSSEDMAAFLELGTPGLNVSASSVREYATDLCAHILGRVGPMDAEEYETYSALGYAMNARVGKDGLELAFEEYLHGTDGVQVTTVSSDGEIVSQYYLSEPIAGSNVITTIDINIQAAAEQALEDVIFQLRAEGVGSESEGTDAEGGAIVVMSVDTGEVLASASYPTFSLATFSEDYEKLLNADYSPIYNRALLAAYEPGSVYKMVTSIAAIDTGKAGRFYELVDQGIYTYYEDYQPTCMLYKYGLTHGTINMMQALAQSCNYYFYEMGRITGIDALDAVAEGLGLGESTGIELPEELGWRANPETKEKLYADDGDSSEWVAGDILQAAIGQGDNKFTPMQLACYTCALANAGTRYRATFLRRISSADYTQILLENEPQIISTYTISDEAMAAVREGMRMAVTEGTASSYLSDYPIAVSAKTGTAQHGSAGSDNASFVCYAPSDSPEIAISVYVEKGAQGGFLSNAARAVMDVYFSEADGVETVIQENIVQ